VVSSAAPESVSGPSRRKVRRAWGGSPRLNGWRQVISSLPVQPASRAVDDGDYATRLEPAHPPGDLGGEGGLPDAAHPIDDKPAPARSGQIGGPATAFGRTDGQRCPVPGPRVRASRVAGRVPDPDRPGRRPACVVSGVCPGPGVRAAGISCGRTACSGTTFSCPTRTNLATSTPLPRTPADGACCHAFLYSTLSDWLDAFS